MKYHFIGIGGVSMSGLAQLLVKMGNQVNGCDIKNCQIDKWSNCQNSNLTIEQFNNRTIYKEHNANHITKDLDGVIVTAAALHENSPAKVEIDKAKKLKIPIIKRSEMIGKLMGKPGIIGIAVAGMHGKTTTSTMISLVLEKAGFDPIALIGSGVKEWEGRNYRMGQGKYFVAEACEYERQMLDFKPKIAVITNLEEEHLDTYPGGIKDIKQAFKKFIKKLPKDGILVVWREDKNLMQLAQLAKKRGNIVREVSLKKIWPGLKLKVPGEYNLLDATFAARVAHEVGVENKIIKDTLSSFTGSARRFEIKGEKNGITVVDDYGHHPTEIKATIKAAREWLNNNSHSDNIPRSNSAINRRLIVVFQPHQYTRTKLLFKDFVNAFDDVDKLIVTDIYLIAGREPKDARADFSKELVKEIKAKGVDAEYISDYKGAHSELHKITKPGDLILTLGATDVYKVGEMLLSK